MKLKATAAVLVLLGSACAGDPSPPPIGLPTCPPGEKKAVEPVEGLVVPPETVIFRSKPSGKRLTVIRGYIDLTPVEIREFYEKVKSRPRYEFFLLEDEVIEAEAFFTDGKWRNFIRARTLCEGRSDLFAIVAPEDYGDAIHGKPSTASPTP